MNISQYIKNEKEKIRQKSPKERLAYFWDYYKWHVLIGIVAVFLLGNTIHSIANQKEAALSGILIDGVQPVETPAIVSDFYQDNGLDPKKQEIQLLTGLSLDSQVPGVASTTYQRIHAGIGAKDTDFLMGYEYSISQCAYDTSHMLADLRDVFTPEQLAQWEEHIFYIDASIVELLKTTPKQEVTFPDPHEPQTMADPIPVAIDISQCAEFTSVYYAPNKAVYIALVVNAPHRELATRFITLLSP